MFFRLKKKAGQHSQNGRVYVGGDVIETELDLAKKFVGKFELLPEEDFEDTGAKSPDIATPTGEGEDIVKVSEPSPGKAKKKAKKKSAKKSDTEVTSDYPDAEDIGVNVFRKTKSNGDWFYVTDPDDDNARMNEKLLREKDVSNFIESITEED